MPRIPPAKSTVRPPPPPPKKNILKKIMHIVKQRIIQRAFSLANVIHYDVSVIIIPTLCCSDGYF